MKRGYSPHASLYKYIEESLAEQYSSNTSARIPPCAVDPWLQMMLASIKSEHGGVFTIKHLILKASTASEPIHMDCRYSKGSGQEWGVQVLTFEPKMDIEVKGLPVTTAP